MSSGAGYTGAGIGVAVDGLGHRAGPVAQRPGRRHRGLHRERRPKRADPYGHGTSRRGDHREHECRTYPGVAPGARLVNLRAMGNDGSGGDQQRDRGHRLGGGSTAREYNLRIINLSLGHPVLEAAADDPLCQAVQRAVDAGILVVAAAGNFGKTADGRPIVGGIVSPGNAPAALTVGALNTKGTVAAVGRRDGDLQLAGPDDDRRRAEAGAGGAGQPDRLDLVEQVVFRAAVSGASGPGGRRQRVHRDERHEHVGRGGLGGGGAAARGQAGADAGARSSCCCS